MFDSDALRPADVCAAPGTEKDIFPHRKMREKCALLWDIADTSFSRRSVNAASGREERAAIDFDFSRRDVSQTGDGVQQGGFS